MAITSLREFLIIHTTNIAISAALDALLGGLIGLGIGAAIATSFSIFAGAAIGFLGGLVLTAFVWGVIYCCKNRRARNNSYGEVSADAIPVANAEVPEVLVSDKRMEDAKKLFERVYFDLVGVIYGDEKSHFFQMHWNAKVKQYNGDIDGLICDLEQHVKTSQDQLIQLAGYCNLIIMQSNTPTQYQNVKELIQRYKESNTVIPDFEYESIDHPTLSKIHIVCTPLNNEANSTTSSGGGITVVKVSNIQPFIDKLEEHLGNEPVGDDVEHQRLTDATSVFSSP